MSLGGQFTRRGIARKLLGGFTGLSLISLTGCLTGTASQWVKYVDGIISAVDAFMASFSGAIPVQIASYIQAVLDALNFIAGELEQTPPLTWKQIALDAVTKLGPLEFQDLTGLTAQQRDLYNAVFNAVKAFLAAIQAQANVPPPAFTRSSTSQGYVHLSLYERHLINMYRSKIESLKNRIVIKAVQ